MRVGDGSGPLTVDGTVKEAPTTPFSLNAEGAISAPNLNGSAIATAPALGGTSVTPLQFIDEQTAFGQDTFVATHNINLHADAGTPVEAYASRNTDVGSGIVSIGVSGCQG